MNFASGRGIELIWLRFAINLAERNKLVIIFIWIYS
jgi:hypothetical protein